MPPLAPSEIPEGCRLALVSPYDVRFSQYRIRAEFQDGRAIDETQQELEAVPYGQKTATEVAEDEALGEIEDLSAAQGKEFDLLTAPFPQIEVTRWRCKLREADGAPRVDLDSGLELYAAEERWFTFDNRRLCCLQKAAAELWPREVRIYVIVIPPALARMRELRKFDTKTSGCSVQIGRRDDPCPETWCWRTRVGVPLEDQLEEGVARQKTPRWRGSRNGARPYGVDSGNGNPNNRGRRQSNNQNGNAEGKEGPELARSAMLFLLVYLALRLTVSMFRKGRSLVGAAGVGSLDGLVDGIVSSLHGVSAQGPGPP